MKDLDTRSFKILGTNTGRIPRSSPVLGNPEPSCGAPGSSLVTADLSGIEERAIAAMPVEETLTLWQADFKLISKGCYRLATRAGAVMYYPTTNKWQHKGRTFTGDILEFRQWLKAKHLLGSHK